MGPIGCFLLTVFVWWFATGAILFLDGLPRRTFKWTIGGATVVTATAFALLVASAHDMGVASAYVAFVCTIVIWGWNEIAFLMGGVTGSRRTACPPDARGMRRFSLAFQTLVYHEALLAACGGLIIAITWSAPNKVALWTFVVLWTMRASAKLNIFFGVPNITHEFLPAHLHYLKSYFRYRPINALLPVSVGAGALVTFGFVRRAAAASDASFDETAMALLASLTALAVLEHLFMVVPLPVGALWAWAMRATPVQPAAVPLVPETRVVPRAGSR